MSDEGLSEGVDESDEFLTRDEFESIWESARGRAGQSRPELLIYPVILLYTGFFLGPFLTAIVSLIVLRGRMHLRHAAFAFGIAGLAWTLSQGLTAYYAPIWSIFVLQFVRSSINFAAGFLTFVLVRSEALDRYTPTRMTLVRTLVAFAVLGALFFMTSTELAIQLGR